MLGSGRPPSRAAQQAGICHRMDSLQLAALPLSRILHTRRATAMPSGMLLPCGKAKRSCVSSVHGFHSARHEYAELHHTCATEVVRGAAQFAHAVRYGTNGRYFLSTGLARRTFATARPTHTPARVRGSLGEMSRGVGTVGRVGTRLTCLPGVQTRGKRDFRVCIHEAKVPVVCATVTRSTWRLRGLASAQNRRSTQRATPRRSASACRKAAKLRGLHLRALTGCHSKHAGVAWQCSGQSGRTQRGAGRGTRRWGAAAALS